MKAPVYIYIAMIAGALLMAPHARAEVAVSPAVLDLKAKARDIIKETVVVKNPTSRKLSVYPTVNNVLSLTGREEFADPSRADLADSLANWIEFSRGVLELEPGESRTVPFEIRVNLTAKHGIYHAAIAFPEGPNRPAAEASRAVAPALTVNLEVAEDIKENIQLKRFAPARKFSWLLPVTFLYELENAGNRTEIPAGDIIIYDQSGREVAAVPANSEKEPLNPAAVKEYESTWHGRAFGQYKAVLSVRYGERSAAQVQDTVFFWVVPWQKIILLALGLTLGLMSLAFYISKRLHRAQWNGHPVFEHPLSGSASPHVVDLRHPPRRDA